jgi:hypothetical protein
MDRDDAGRRSGEAGGERGLGLLSRVAKLRPKAQNSGLRRLDCDGPDVCLMQGRVSSA